MDTRARIERTDRAHPKAEAPAHERGVTRAERTQTPKQARREAAGDVAQGAAQPCQAPYAGVVPSLVAESAAGKRGQPCPVAKAARPEAVTRGVQLAPPGAAHGRACVAQGCCCHQG